MEGEVKGSSTYSVDLLEKLRELAGDVGGVTVEDGSVTGTNLSRVVEDNDLGVERGSFHCGIIFRAGT
jgi:hypothetical protein